MNQRKGKWKPAAIPDTDLSAMKLVSFFKKAKHLLEQEGHEDAAFYFEQCEEWIRQGKSLTDESAARILGL